MTKIICLHAAEANRQLIDEAMNQLATPISVTLEHIVNQELLSIIREQKSISLQKSYVYETMMKIISQAPDAIFITCTNYIGLIDKIKLPTTVPIIKIDELLFLECNKATKPIKLLFTNEHTISSTMARANKHITTNLAIESVYIPQLFDLYVNGKTEEHDVLLFDSLLEQDFAVHTIVVGQLSMVRAAHRCQTQLNLPVLDATSAFVSYLERIKFS